MTKDQFKQIKVGDLLALRTDLWHTRERVIGVGIGDDGDCIRVREERRLVSPVGAPPSVDWTFGPEYADDFEYAEKGAPPAPAVQETAAAEALDPFDREYWKARAVAAEQALLRACGKAGAK